MDFTVTWRDAEADRFWLWDESHWPHPTTPLNATLELPAMAAGFTRACRALHRPFPAYHVKVVHGFVYFGFDLELNAATRAARVAAHQATLTPRIQDAFRFWREDVLPEIIAGNDHMRATPWQSFSDTELAGALADLVALRTRQWELHDLVLVPAMAALDGYLGAYRRWFPAASPDAPHAVLHGFPNQTTRIAAALWRIGQDPDVQQYVTAVAGDGGRAGTMMPPAALRDYLDAYGWRTDGWELADSAVYEAPAMVFARLRAIAAGVQSDPDAMRATAVAERDQRLTELLAQLPDEQARAAFQATHAAATAYPILSEDHNFYIDQMGLTSLRVPVRVMGARLAHRSVLDDADDVFFLTRAELSAALVGDVLPDIEDWPGVGDARARVAARRADRAQRRNFRPPPTLGTTLTPELAADPLYADFFGVRVDPPAGGRVIRGVGAVPGVVAGRARIIKNLADADDLEPGDILVCPMTSPAWTPLFLQVAAVVADAGGILSHTAIVAREFGLPCVVATRIACRDLRDGEWIEVDGGAGEVRRVSHDAV